MLFIKSGTKELLQKSSSRFMNQRSEDEKIIMNDLMKTSNPTQSDLSLIKKKAGGDVAPNQSSMIQKVNLQVNSPHFN